MARLMSGLLFGVRPTDPLTFGGASSNCRGFASLLHSRTPRRARRSDPRSPPGITERKPGTVAVFPYLFSADCQAPDHAAQAHAQAPLATGGFDC
jgi:hypothetical protein